jgi:purine nucleosidase
VRVHLDTDFGGDPDDACALAMLLGWPGVELVGVTTTIDADGFRAACVAHCLDLAGRADVPVAAGAGRSLTTGRRADPFRDGRYWPDALRPDRAPPGAALDLLARSIEAGATIVAIGPVTNLALLEVMRPGLLAGTAVTVMGGWIEPPGVGFPPWGPELDFNIQWDTRAAEIVFAATNLTLCPLAAAMRAPLRAADLPRLRASGPLGALLARQSETCGDDSGLAALGRVCPGWPDDLVNVHWDPVACAAALGWDGIAIEAMRLTPVREGDVLRFRPARDGRPTRVVASVDGERFGGTWLAAVAAAQQPGARIASRRRSR